MVELLEGRGDRSSRGDRRRLGPAGDGQRARLISDERHGARARRVKGDGDPLARLG